MLAILLFFSAVAFAQQPENKDTLVKVKSLDSLTFYTQLNQNVIRQLPSEHGTYIFSGKKTEVINLAHTAADIANKTGRQVFAKIPGVFVYDMDGSGNQINIAARGL
ncbi:MAG: TonB-dependent receptor, partial [Gloeobacteraceae cyanobacterium ES-bin-316]|nr:TonB-dependent receptor [Ferruginibacter sp.]